MRTIEAVQPPFKVPTDLTRDQVKALAKRLVPVMRNDNDRLCRIANIPRNLFEVSFLWDARPGWQIKLRQVDEFYTVHYFGYRGFFKPSMAEVLQQIPARHHGLKKAYYEVQGPDDAADCNEWIEHINAGVHVAITKLYVKAGWL